MTEKEKSFMHRAIQLAEKGMKNGSGGPFGAVVVKNDKSTLKNLMRKEALPLFKKWKEKPDKTLY